MFFDFSSKMYEIKQSSRFSMIVENRLQNICIQMCVRVCVLNNKSSFLRNSFVPTKLILFRQ